jgi:hypothetical protein
VSFPEFLVQGQIVYRILISRQMLQGFSAATEGMNTLRNIKVTAYLYELYGYVAWKLRSWCLYFKFAEALNNKEAMLLGEYSVL